VQAAQAPKLERSESRERPEDLLKLLQPHCRSELLRGCDVGAVERPQAPKKAASGECFFVIFLGVFWGKI